MKISVALATYNGEEYLLEQLQSITNQTRGINEIIIIDDSSIDRTVNIAQEFLSDFSFEKKIITNDRRLGAYRNFEKALLNCTGEIIFLSDQDDIWYPDKVETHIKLHEENQDIQVITNDCLLSDKHHHTFGHTKMKNLNKAGINLTSMVMGCCCSFKKDFLKKALPFSDEFKGHDNWLCYLADKKQVRLILPQTLQLYRQHGSNTSDYFVNNEKGLNFYQKIIGYLRSKNSKRKNKFYIKEIHGK